MGHYVSGPLRKWGTRQKGHLGSGAQGPGTKEGTREEGHLSNGAQSPGTKEGGQKRKGALEQWGTESRH